MREIKLCMQVLQVARRLSRAAHAERCHWSEGKESHNASNARGRRGVTAGKMERNSSVYNACSFGVFIDFKKWSKFKRSGNFMNCREN